MPTLNAHLGPHQLTPPWTAAHSTLALREGWEIFDCDGSSCGRWQIDELDSPEEWQHITGTVPPKLESAEVAWRIVANGTQPHHEAAREFLKVHNPEEYERVMRRREV